MSIKYSDSGFLDGADETKKLSFDVSGVTTGTTRTITMPDANVDLSSVGTPDDNSVTLAKMAHGTDGEIITYDSSGAPATVGVGTSGQVLTSNGAGSAPSMQDAGGGNATYYRVTDSTDTVIATTASSANAIGSSFSMDIPTEGIIRLVTTDATVIGTGAGYINPYFGFKIGSTVYPFIYHRNNTTMNVDENFTGYPSTAKLTIKGSTELVASIAAMVYINSMPTSTQTVSLVVWEKEGDSGGVIKGTTRTTNITIEVIDAT